MKIGIMTFHWATNYGAILQAYALQTFLQQQGHEVYIIRYHPLQNMLLQRIEWVREHRSDNFFKEKLLRQFRKKNLRMSKRCYFTSASLKQTGNLYDLYICGSDQVWNYSFIQYAEYGRETYSYFLDFVDSCKRKISYAASFGTNLINKSYSTQIEKHLLSFEAVSVRERTAVSILSEMHCESMVVCDPTILLEPQNYRGLFASLRENEAYTLSYKLHKQQKEYEKIEESIAQGGEKIVYIDTRDGINDWLTKIAYARFVITNSFHGTVFAVLFHIPFMAVGVEHSNMDERFITFLSALRLENRFISNFDVSEVTRIITESIDWESVDCLRNNFSKQSQDWLMAAVKGVVQ